MHTPLAAERPDLYGHIHKALRLFMVDTLSLIGATDPRHEAETQAALAQLKTLLDSCEMHIRHENAYLHPLLERASAGASASTVDEHLRHEGALNALRRSAVLVARAGPATRAGPMARLYRALALFVAENFEHMHHEETVLGALLWRHFSDAELRATEQAIVAALPPTELLRTLNWLLPALSAPERAGLLQGLRAALPAGAFEAVWGVARARLAVPAYARLARELDVDPVPGLVARVSHLEQAA